MENRKGERWDTSRVIALFGYIACTLCWSGTCWNCFFLRAIAPRSAPSVTSTVSGLPSLKHTLSCTNNKQAGGKRLHPRVLDSSSRSQPADADSKQPLGGSGLRRHKPATRQEFDLARRNLSQTVSGSPITDSSDGSALRARKNDSAVTGIGARSRETSVVSPRSVFTTRTSANRSSSPQRPSSGGRSAIGQSAFNSPLSLAPVSRAL